MVAGEALDGKSLKSVQEQILRHRDRALVGAFENLLSTGRIRSFLGDESYTRLLIDGFQGNPEKFELLEDLYRSILHEYKIGNAPYNRSEERRVGKECRPQWCTDREKEK